MQKGKGAKGRIVFVAPGPYIQGGISTVVENYKRSSFFRGYECLHFGTCKETSSTWAKLVYAAWRYFVFIWVLIFYRPDVVSVHSAVGVSFYRKLVYIMLTRCFRCVAVWHIHPAAFYDFYIEGSQYRKAQVLFAGRMSSKIVFLTQDMVNKFNRVWPGKPASVVPNPVDTKVYGSGSRSSMKGNYKILYMGWIIQDKGVYDIVEVIPKILESYPEACFIFAGSKEVTKLRKIIQDRGLTGNTKVLDWVNGEVKLNLLRTSRMLLLPSYTEGVPNVILEAMASGLPIITTPVGGIPSVFIEGENGYYVIPGNREELGARILQLLEDDADCERISKLTRQRVKEKYDLEVIAQKLEAVYTEFLHSNGSDGNTVLR